GDYDAKVHSADDRWQAVGKNGSKINLTFVGDGTYSSKTVEINGHKWWVYDGTKKINVILDGEQDVAADTYTVTLHVGEYQS
ncbi:Saf-pilin pilus formation protein SafA, partial [Yersinia enterocolitica]|nr:Saf-pilin pilus formation protein SafA [Yersinia enterocolitica]